MSDATCRTPHDEIGCLGRHRGRLKDSPVVALENFQPGAEVVRMANSWGDTELGAEESRAEFSDEFLAGISLAAVSPGEIAVETRWAACPMASLMQNCPVPIYGLKIGLLRGNLNEVVARRIERHVTADPYVRARRRDNRIDM